MSRFRPRLAAALAGLMALLLGGPAPLRAEDEALPRRNVGVAVEHQKLFVTFGYREAFTPAVRRKLKSGLTTRVVVQIGLEEMGSGKPVGFWARDISLVYDLWEERFVVTMNDQHGQKRASLATLEQAVEMAGVLARGEIAETRGLPAGSYRIRALVEVNPVSRKMVDNIRRWLARKPEGSGGLAGNESFFGSFVGIFVDRDIGKADSTVAFVSQEFAVGGGP